MIERRVEQPLNVGKQIEYELFNITFHNGHKEGSQHTILAEDARNAVIENPAKQTPKQSVNDDDARHLIIEERKLRRDKRVPFPSLLKNIIVSIPIF